MSDTAELSPDRAPVSTDDGLDRLFAEYDQTIPPNVKPAERIPAETDQQQPSSAQPPARDEASEHLRRDLEHVTLREWAVAVDGELARIQHERQSEIDNRDFEMVVQSVEDDLGDVPEGWVRRYLLGEAQLDPELAKTWVNRHAGEEGVSAFLNKVGRVRRDVARVLARRPDPEATEDRALVAQAVVRGTSNYAPEAKPRDYSRMSNNEFSDAVKRSSAIGRSEEPMPSRSACAPLDGSTNCSRRRKKVTGRTDYGDHLDCAVQPLAARALMGLHGATVSARSQ
jgi:hypothetical protein